MSMPDMTTTESATTNVTAADVTTTDMTMMPDPATVRESAGAWRRIAFSTEPIAHEAAVRAVDALYTLATGSGAPEIIWCASPAEAARLVVGQRDRLGESLRERMRTQPWERARGALFDRLGGTGFVRAMRETCGGITPTVARLVEQIGASAVAEGDSEPERIQLNLALTFADHGQHDAAWLPLFEAYRSADADGEMLHALAAVAEQTHWWWPFANAAVLCERPVAMHLDELGRLHYGEGPALAYADGFELYRWRGVAIPKTFAQTLTALTPEIIRGERNAELRRIMLEHYGHDRYIVDSGAEPVQQDEAGRLWRVRLPDDEPIAMVEVVNSTAEPDGTFRTYWLRVPPSTATAKAGVAWTFGLTEAEYAPLVQT
jgi:hypothetical protein